MRCMSLTCVYFLWVLLCTYVLIPTPGDSWACSGDEWCLSLGFMSRALRSLVYSAWHSCPHTHADIYRHTYIDTPTHIQELCLWSRSRVLLCLICSCRHLCQVSGWKRACLHMSFWWVFWIFWFLCFLCFLCCACFLCFLWWCLLYLEATASAADPFNFDTAGWLGNPFKSKTCDPPDPPKSF